MQGLADGYFIIPNTIGDYLARAKPARVGDSHPAFRDAENAVSERTKKFLSIRGQRTVGSFHRELGKIMWDYCGMSRNEAGLKLALQRIPELRREFWRDVKVPGSGVELNQSLERAGRVADFLELGERLHRCAHRQGRASTLREESQTPTAKLTRRPKFSYVAPGNMRAKVRAEYQQGATGVR